jgi:hypothetical protein
MTSICHVPISIGELYDKYSILEIKFEKIVDASKLFNVQKEMEYLQPLLDVHLLSTDEHSWMLELKQVNRLLWDIEVQLREKETRHEFDQEFILLARSVYQINDRRSALKWNINQSIGSEIVEVKSYLDGQSK